MTSQIACCRCKHPVLNAIAPRPKVMTPGHADYLCLQSLAQHRWSAAPASLAKVRWLERDVRTQTCGEKTAVSRYLHCCSRRLSALHHAPSVTRRPRRSSLTSCASPLVERYWFSELICSPPPHGQRVAPERLETRKRGGGRGVNGLSAAWLPPLQAGARCTLQCPRRPQAMAAAFSGLWTQSAPADSQLN